jgi:hypothetical protein
MNHLRAKPRLSSQPQSSLIKPNQVIFLVNILPIIGQNTTFCICTFYILHSAFCI